MRDLADYARRAAEHDYEARIDADTVDSYRALAYRDGILHLAERLQEPDVIEAGVLAAHDHDERFSFESPTGYCDCSTVGYLGGPAVSVPWSGRHQVEMILTAMFAHIAEEVA